MPLHSTWLQLLATQGQGCFQQNRVNVSYGATFLAQLKTIKAKFKLWRIL